MKASNEAIPHCANSLGDVCGWVRQQRQAGLSSESAGWCHAFCLLLPSGLADLNQIERLLIQPCCAWTTRCFCAPSANRNSLLCWLLTVLVTLQGQSLAGSIADVPAGEYVPGDRVSATFHAGCPRNNLRTNDTFLTVERKDSSGWTVVSHHCSSCRPSFTSSINTSKFHISSHP